MDDADDNNASNVSGKTAKPNVCTTKGGGENSPESCQSKKDLKEPCSEDTEKMEDSPVLGLLTGNKTPKSEAEKFQSHEKEPPSEIAIKKAIRKRAAYIKANSEYATSLFKMSLIVLLLLDLYIASSIICAFMFISLSYEIVKFSVVSLLC